MAKKTIRCCAECHAELPAPTEGYPRQRRFCTDKCRAKFKNRKMVRGGDIYDLLFAWRFDRANFEKHGGRKLLSRMIAEWKREDDEAGRKSHDDIGSAIDRLLSDGRLTVVQLSPAKY